MDETYAQFTNEQFAKLCQYDHDLFQEIFYGLRWWGWRTVGGNMKTYLEMSKGDRPIKIYRDPESYATIKIAFTAPPEKDNGN